MKYIIQLSICSGFFLIALLSGCTQRPYLSSLEPSDRGLTNAERDLKYTHFLNPPNEHRSHPFYSLNDKLEADELRRQIKGFKAAGFGGFYLHSRPGLLTDYLSEEWWALMEVAVATAKEEGLRCMFYDEDKWPSGFAGGLIPALSEDYRAKGLAKIDHDATIPEGCKLLKTDGAYQYVQYTAQFGYDIFNGTCYVDMFNPHAVKAFIESTHRPYFQKFGNQIAPNELFIFTDEPHIHARYFEAPIKNYGTLSYSNYLEDYFLESYGYSLREHVDLLFEEKDNWREVRWHYYRAKARLFEASFTRQIADYCEQHGAQLTGHYLGEDRLRKVRDRIGNSSLHYRSMQQPGIDHLGLSIANRLITPKYLSSVANQYGKSKRLSELFGITGHNLNFQERRWLGGWHAILGVNHFCPHLTAYSLKGARKRDYPPTFSYHQPYWAYNKQIEDYLGRISYISTIGEATTQVLVISPLESEYLKAKDEPEFTHSTLAVLEALQQQHITYDLGDEEIISDIGRTSGNRLTVGKMRYEAVVIPDMLTIRSSTLKLLLEFQANGGTIIRTGALPLMVDAKTNPELLTALAQASISLPIEGWSEKLVTYLQSPLPISGESAELVWLQTRVIDNQNVYLLYNSSNLTHKQVSIQAPKDWKSVLLWDPTQADVYQIPITANGSIDLSLSPAGFYWLTAPNSYEDVPCKELSPPLAESSSRFTLDTPWRSQRLAPNALVLDFAAYSTDGGLTYSTPEPVIGIWNRLQAQGYEGKLRLKFSAKLQNIPAYCALAIEQPYTYDHITVNQMTVEFSGSSYFIDPAIQAQDISPILQLGENDIELQIHFSTPVPQHTNPAKRYETELESIYLIGDFGVFAESIDTTVLTQRNRSADLMERPAYGIKAYYIADEELRHQGQLPLEGYPFYAGSFILSNTLELATKMQSKRYYIDLSACEAITTEIAINGQIVDTLCWAPYLVDITDHLKEGENQIQLTITNSLRNLLGPHHHQGAELIKVGPNSFTGAGGFPDGRGQANWYDQRKEKAELIIWTDTYYHIPFGLLGPVSVLVK